MSLKEKVFKATHERNALQRFVARKWLFNLLQPLGVHITADHFYEIVPNTRLVARQYSSAPRELHGIDWQFEQSERRASDWVRRYGAEFSSSTARFGYTEANHYFRGLDALVYYGCLRDRKPMRVVEIGQGYSTRIALAALNRNAQETGVAPKLVSVDPYPRMELTGVESAVDLEIVEADVNDVRADTIVTNCDLLFVDSSHVHKFGSDVAYEVTTLYPRLSAGTILHVHDIFSPFDYPREWIVEERRFWNEQYLLECFLMFNSQFEVLVPLHLLGARSALLADAIATLPTGETFHAVGSSLYLERV